MCRIPTKSSCQQAEVPLPRAARDCIAPILNPTNHNKTYRCLCYTDMFLAVHLSLVHVGRLRFLQHLCPVPGQCHSKQPLPGSCRIALRRYRSLIFPLISPPSLSTPNSHKCASVLELSLHLSDSFLCHADSFFHLL